jgi:predicted Zn-dependent peptidase
MSKPQVTVLKNGLTVISQHNPGEQVCANITVAVGNRHENSDQKDVAHFLEHMAASETQRMNIHEREHYISKRYGTSNALTMDEYTSYHLQMNKAFAEDAVELLADGFLRPKFDDENVESERESVETELRNGASNPALIAGVQLAQVAFPDMTTGELWSDIADRVHTHDTQKLKDFKDIHYTSDNMALSVVGDVKHEDVVAWAEKHFAGLPEKTTIPRQAPTPAAYRGGMVTYESKDAEELLFHVAFESSGNKNPQQAAIDELLADILGGGNSSRLHQTLVEEKQISREAYASNDALQDNGTFNIVCATSPDQAKEAFATIAEEAMRLTSSLTQEELDKTRNQLAGALERSSENIQKISSKLSTTKAVEGQIFDVQQRVALYNSITLEQLQERAAQLFTSAPSVSVHGNELQKLPAYEEIAAAFGQKRQLDSNGLVVQTKQERAEALARATAPGKPFEQVQVPTGEASPKQAKPEAFAPQITVLENGLKVVTQKMPSKQISANLRVGSGNRHEDYNKTSMADVVCEISGTASQRLSVGERAEAVANMRGVSGCGASLESTSFGIRSANAFADEALRMLAETVSAPKFDAEEARKQQVQIKKHLLSEKINPQENTRQQMRRVAFPGSQMDKDPLGTAEGVTSHSLEDLVAFKDQHYTTDNMVLSVVGDVEHEAIVAQAKKLFSGVKTHPEHPRKAPPEARYRGGMEVKNSDASDQVTVRIGFEGSSQQQPKTNAVDKLIAGILGGGFSSRLMTSLRTKKGLVYGAMAFNSPMSDCGLFTIATGTHEDKLGKTMDAIIDEVNRFADTVTQEELDVVKSDMLGDYEREIDLPAVLSETLAERAARGASVDIKEDIRLLEDVTLDDIKSRAREIFSTAPSIAAFGKGAERMPSYEKITEKLGKKRSLDASGLAIDTAPSQSRHIGKASLTGGPEEQRRIVG